jgi:glyoxylase-like metal-dependent hydrolase (beta-lactamase superfamily II)
MFELPEVPQGITDSADAAGVTSTVLSGDVLFAGSIGRTDFPMSDHAALIDSVTTKLWPLGDDTAFIPGHGPMSNFARERQHNPFVGDSVLG